jgi:hypothetical protein
VISKDLKDLLITNEKAIVDAQKRRDVTAVDALLAEDFREIGSSGRMFCKSDVLDGIKESQIVDCSFEEFRFLRVDSTCVIVTYVTTATRILQGLEQSRRAYRSSTWVERNGAWRIIFHQGTVLTAA